MEEYQLTFEGKSIFRTNDLMKICYILAVLEEVARTGDDATRLALMAILKQEARKREGADGKELDHESKENIANSDRV